MAAETGRANSPHSDPNAGNIYRQTPPNTTGRFPSQTAESAAKQQAILQAGINQARSSGGGGSPQVQEATQKLQNLQAAYPQQSINQQAQTDIKTITSPTSSQVSPIQVGQQVSQANNQNLQTGYYKDNVRYDSYEDYIRANPSGSISAYRPPTIAEKIRAAMIPGQKVGSQLATQEELNRAGISATYKVGQAYSTVPSGRGTVVNAPVQTGFTKQDVKDFQIKQAEAQVKNIQTKVGETITQQTQQAVIQRGNVYQAQVNAGTLNVDEANTKYKSDVEAINAKSNEEYKAQLESNPQYQSAVKNYQSAASKTGASTDVYGRTYFPALEKLTTPPTIRERAREAIVYTPLGGPILMATAPTQAIYNPKTGQITEKLTKEGILQSAIGAGFTLLGAGSLALSAGKSLVQEQALSALNRKIIEGGYKFTEAEIKSGVVIVEGQKLNLGTKGIQKVISQQERQAAIQRFNRLPQQVTSEFVGTIQEKTILKNELLNKMPTQDVKEILSTSSYEIGTYKAPKPFGKGETGIILKGTIQTPEGGVSKALTFRVTKAGELLKPRIALSDLQQGYTLYGRPAMPSELVKTSIKVPKNVNPLKAEEFNRVKITKIFAADKGQVVSKSAEHGDIILTKTLRKSNLFEVGGKQKGTLSELDIARFPKGERALKVKQPVPVSNVKSVRFESMQKEAQNLFAPSGVSGIDLKVGTIRKGVSFEKNIAERLPKPIKFTEAPKVSTRNTLRELYGKLPIEQPPIVKPVSNMPKTSQPIVRDFPAEMPPEAKYPSYITGGRGNVQSAFANPKVVSNAVDFGIEAPPLTMSAIDRSVAVAIKELNVMSRIRGISKIGSAEKVTFKNIPAIKFNVEAQKVLTAEKINSNLQLQNIAIKQIMDQTKIMDNKLMVGQRVGIISAKVLEQPQAIKLQNKQLQEQINKLNDIQEGRFKYPDVKPITSFDIPGFPFGSGGSQGAGSQRQAKKIKKQIKKMQSAYTASLAAAAFQIKPTKVTRKQFAKLQSVQFTGAEYRPVLEIVTDEAEIKRQIRKVNF